MIRMYTCSFKGMTRKYLGHRFKNYWHRKRQFNEPMQATVYILSHRTCCFMQINQFYVRLFGSFSWCMLYTVIILNTMRHLLCLCWMVSHLGCSAPLPKTADPELDTDSVTMSLSLSHWYTGSGVVLDCIDSGLNTGAKEIQQVNHSGPDKQPKHKAPTISSIDKSLSRNHHRVWSLTHRRAIKEESKAANRDWVDYQACSLLQYINIIANLFIMGNYFNKPLPL